MVKVWPGNAHRVDGGAGVVVTEEKLNASAATIGVKKIHFCSERSGSLLCAIFLEKEKISSMFRGRERDEDAVREWKRW